MKTATKNSQVKQSKNAASRGKGQEQNSGSEAGLRKLFEDGLKDIYWAEKALTKALPKMAKKATSEELLDAINEHIDITMEQVTRLEEVFETIGKKAQAKKCDAMEGLIKEANSIIEETEDGVVRDAGIIAASQKVEHYEIATYGTLCAWAKILGEEDAAGLLEETLNEEKEADEILTQVAESSVNIEAAEEDEEEEEDEENEEDDEEKAQPKTSSKSRKK